MDEDEMLISFACVCSLCAIVVAACCILYHYTDVFASEENTSTTSNNDSSNNSNNDSSNNSNNNSNSNDSGTTSTHPTLKEHLVTNLGVEWTLDLPGSELDVAQSYSSKYVSIRSYYILPPEGDVTISRRRMFSSTNTRGDFYRDGHVCCHKGVGVEHELTTYDEEDPDTWYNFQPSSFLIKVYDENDEKYNLVNHRNLWYWGGGTGLLSSINDDLYHEDRLQLYSIERVNESSTQWIIKNINHPDASMNNCFTIQNVANGRFLALHDSRSEQSLAPAGLRQAPAGKTYGESDDTRHEDVWEKYWWTFDLVYSGEQPLLVGMP